jgi:CheY-like chemotaxis protein
MMSTPVILLVDDDPSVLRLAQFGLEDRGLAVTLAESGDLALKLLRHADFKLVVLDLMMPGKNGFEVLEILRASERNANVPVYFLTAMANPQESEGAHMVDVLGYLRKPFDPFKFATTVELALESAG